VTFLTRSPNPFADAVVVIREAGNRGPCEPKDPILFADARTRKRGTVSFHWSNSVCGRAIPETGDPGTRNPVLFADAIVFSKMSIAKCLMRNIVPECEPGGDTVARQGEYLHRHEPVDGVSGAIT